MPVSDETIRLVLADDHPTTRAGIRALLSEAPDIQIIGEAHTLLFDRVLTGD